MKPGRGLFWTNSWTVLGYNLIVVVVDIVVYCMHVEYVN